MFTRSVPSFRHVLIGTLLVLLSSGACTSWVREACDCGNVDVDDQPGTLEFRAAQDSEAPGYEARSTFAEESDIYVSVSPALDQTDIKRIDVMYFPREERRALLFEFHAESSPALSEFSRAQRGKRIAVLIDGSLFIAPPVLEVIPESNPLVVINTEPGWTAEEACFNVCWFRLKAIGEER